MRASGFVYVSQYRSGLSTNMLATGRLASIPNRWFSKPGSSCSKAPVQRRAQVQKQRLLRTSKHNRGNKIQAVYTKEDTVKDFVKFKPPCIDIRDVLSGSMPSTETVQKARYRLKMHQKSLLYM